jgi:hypothetical protein
LNLHRILPAALASILFLIAQSASAAVNTPAAQVSEERQRNRSTAPAVGGARRNTAAGARPDQSGKAGKAQQVKGQTVRANSDRLRSLLNRQAIRHGAAVAASRRAGAANPSQARTNPSQGAAASAPNMTARRAAVAPSQNSAAQNSASAARTGTLGGPRAPAYARLGGPASAKPAHAAALSGSQVLRPKY